MLNDRLGCLFYSCTIPGSEGVPSTLALYENKLKHNFSFKVYIKTYEYKLKRYQDPTTEFQPMMLYNMHEWLPRTVLPRIIDSRTRTPGPTVTPKPMLK